MGRKNKRILILAIALSVVLSVLTVASVLTILLTKINVTIQPSPSVSSSPPASVGPSSSASPTASPSPPPPPPFIPDPAVDYSAELKKPWIEPTIFTPRLGEVLTANNGIAVCSTGAYAIDKKTRKIYLLTAKHCGDGTFYTSELLGLGRTSSKVLEGDDIQAVEVDGGSADVRHFNSVIPLTGEAIIDNGGRVCRTGAKTGTICNLVITNAEGENVIYVNGEKHFLIKMQAWKPEKLATAVGDSGGIVYVEKDGQAKIIGIQAAGNMEIKCPKRLKDTRCFTEAFVAPIDKFLEENNLTLITSKE